MAMKNDAFSAFHPIVNFSYFAAVIGFSMFLMHPICLFISLILAFIYSVRLGGRKAVMTALKFMLPMMIFTALLNPLFNHQGATILAYLPNGNPVTLESIMFGAAAAAMLAAVISWFSCFNSVMTSDKFVYLFGRIIPALSLILAMALRFVPRFRKQAKVISNAQKGIGRDVSDGNILRKIRHGAKILSIMITWALENAIETSGSMKNRGYGLKCRTAFSIFKFERRDGYALLFVFICTAVMIIGFATGIYHFRYFPTIRVQWISPGAITIFVVYFALCAFPIAIDLKEELLWRRIESKI